MSDPRSPLAPACATDERTQDMDDLAYKGIDDETLEGLASMSEIEGGSPGISVIIRCLAGELLRRRRAARGAVIVLDFDQARLLWGLCRAWLEGVVYRAGSGPTHELTRERIEAVRATLQAALAPSERQP